MRRDIFVKTLNINTECNLNCSFCKMASKPASSMGLSAVSKEARSFKNGGFGRVVIAGGEPALSPHIFKLIKAAKLFAVPEVELITNGIILSDGNFAEKLVSCGVSSLRLLYVAHTPESYDRITRTVGRFEALNRAMETISRSNIKTEVIIPIFRDVLRSAGGSVQYVLEKYPAIKDIYIVPVTANPPEIKDEAEIEQLADCMKAMTAAADKAGKNLHYNFWKTLPEDVKENASPDLRRFLAHSAACPDCAGAACCAGVNSAGAFFSDKLLSSPEKFTSFRSYAPGEERKSAIEHIMNYSREKGDLLSLDADSQGETNRINHAVIRIDFHCNQKCLFCFNLKRPQVKNSDIEYLIKSVLKYFDAIKVFSISGGEPMINRDVNRYVSLLKEGRTQTVEIQTNATLVSAKAAKSLAAAGLDKAFVSLHSNVREVSEFITGTPGDFDKTVAGIHNLLDNGIRVSINHLLNAHNHAYFAQYVKFVAAEFPTATLVFSMAQPYLEFPDSMMKHIARFSEFKDRLREGLDWCVDNNINFTSIQGMCGIPNCVLRGEKKYYKQNALSLNLKTDSTEMVKLSRCAECEASGNCYGVRKRYIEYFGDDEIIPVRK